MPCTLVDDATQELLQWADIVRTRTADAHETAQQLARRLGAHYRNGYAEVGFWVPELVDDQIPDENVFLEVLTPIDSIDLKTPEAQTVRFRREEVALARAGEYLWGVIDGMTAGTRDAIGSFYWVRYQNREGNWHTIVDHLAYSVPFGTRAPAEFYDMERVQRDRADREHFSKLVIAPDPDGMPRVQAPVNILQIHPGTASAEKSIAGLTRIYQAIGHKQRNSEPLSAAEENYVGYDAVQLMPVEPPIEHEAGPLFWEMDTTNREETVTVTLRQHDITNWGYDVMISASPAVNPAITSSKRPDELVDFIATLHTMPNGPIMAMFDIVYGHTDNQAIGIMNKHFLAGANMYGQNLNYRQPVVRAILLEMQRRKSDYGVDGIRVDGAQDFKGWDAETDTMYHDDEYLRQMNDLVQEVAGVRYRPWMIFEDGRPWPRDDWELASTYREVTKLMPNVWQWGPLTFAHNTPFLFTFWASKWWRIREIQLVGREWITGCANHDTLRRGTQVDPEGRINTRLGNSLPEILQAAYDNPAAKLFDYAMMPGVPMDFINAAARAPWSFIRNTDDRYGVKVVSEESRFLSWAMDEARFADPETFPRLKAMGFTDLNGLRRFLKVLDQVVQATNYNLPNIVTLMQHFDPPLDGPDLSVAVLKEIANAWMTDIYAYCNVARYEHLLDPARTKFNLQLREFRRARPWLMDNMRPDEFLDRRQPSNGTVLFYGLRRSPDEREETLFVANMEGEPISVLPTDLPIPNLPKDGWTLSIASPGIFVEAADHSLTLHDSQGVVFTRITEA